MQSSFYQTDPNSQRIPMNYAANNSNFTSPNQQMNRPDLFRRRNQRIDWRRIAAVDVDRIAYNLDFQTLQDNLEQITFCNIDTEVDLGKMDPNFIKLYKIAQYIIEYLLYCQEQITTEREEFEQNKGKMIYDIKKADNEIKELKDELDKAKKELKKRRKMLETQQRLLTAQNSNYHTCPVCTHAFLSVAYLQAHMGRRHPEYDPNRRREHDVDAEKETQHLREELRRKDSEFQNLKTAKAVDDEKLRSRDEDIRRLKEENQRVHTQLTILDERILNLRSSMPIQTSSPHRTDAGISELLKENNELKFEINRLKELLQKIEHNLTREGKHKQRLEKEIEKLNQENSQLKDNLRLLQSTSGDSQGLKNQLITFQNQLNEERLRSRKLEEELEDAHKRLARLQDQPIQTTTRKSPSPPTSRKSPVPSIRAEDSPVQMRPMRPKQTTDVILQDYCPNLIERVKENPTIITRYRDEARKQFYEELEEYEHLGITEEDTRLTERDYRTKMESVLQTRRNIQDDLPSFERIRNNINQIADRLVGDRLGIRRSTTSIRSIGSKLVTFEDERQNPKYSVPIHDHTKQTSVDQYRTSGTTAIDSIAKYNRSRPITNSESDEDVTTSNANQSGEEDTRSGNKNYSRSSLRNPVSTSNTKPGINALVAKNLKPSTKGDSTISALAQQLVAKPTSTTQLSNSESEDETSAQPSLKSVTEKKRFIEQKLHEASIKGQKPSINAIAQGFQPSKASLAGHDEVDEESESLTTLNTNASSKATNGQLPRSSTSSRTKINK